MNFMRGATEIWWRLFAARDTVRPAETTTGIKNEPVFEEYIDLLPSPQNAVDLVPYWNNALPPEAQATNQSNIVLYADPRIEWCIQQFGNLADRTILELGPLEASHTYILHAQQPASILAIEANRLAFIRCLIVKELLGLSRAKFMVGDFVKWLETSSTSYDLIVASGVLYHMRDPVRLIELMSKRSNSLYLWTHYFSEEAMPLTDIRRGAFTGEVLTAHCEGLEIRLHKRKYHGAGDSKVFCGGMRDEHYWLEKDQILQILKALGYSDLRLAHESTDFPNGPSMSIFARR